MAYDTDTSALSGKIDKRSNPSDERGQDGLGPIFLHPVVLNPGQGSTTHQPAAVRELNQTGRKL